MESTWAYQDLEKHYYMYMDRTGSSDVLFDITSLVLNSSEANKIKEEFINNFKATLEASSIPFYVSMSAASISLTNLLESLLSSAKLGCEDSLNTLMFIKSKRKCLNSASAIIPTFHELHKNNILTEQFEILYKLIAIRFYGCLEELFKMALKSILLHDLSKLEILADSGLKIGNSNCITLKNRVEQDCRDNDLTTEESYDENILNKGFNVTQYIDLFSKLTDLSISNDNKSSLVRFESSRHLLVHRSAKIDQKYINETNGDNSLIGQQLCITPSEMYNWQNSVITAVCALIVVVDATCF